MSSRSSSCETSLHSSIRNGSAKTSESDVDCTAEAHDKNPPKTEELVREDDMEDSDKSTISESSAQDDYSPVERASGDGEADDHDGIPELLAGISHSTASRYPKKVRARLFIGHLRTSGCSRADILRIFHRYGRIEGLSLHKGFAFVQFEKRSSALCALASEQKRTLHGRPIRESLKLILICTCNVLKENSAGRLACFESFVCS